MQTVNIAELKNKLSVYLKKVRSGEEIIVKDRDVPVAKIIPFDGDQDEQLADLASRAIVKLGEGIIEEQFWDLPAPKVSSELLNDVITAERDE